MSSFFENAGGWGGLLSALVNMGGNIAGGLLSQTPNVNYGKVATAQPGPDQTTQALQNLALMQLGIVPAGAGVAGSPFQQVVNLAAQRGSLTQDNLTRLTGEFNNAVGAVESGSAYRPGDRAWLLDFAAQQAGYRNGLELAQAEAQFRAGRGERESAAASQARSNYDARQAAQQTLNQLVSSYRAPTSESIEALRVQMRDQILRELSQQERDATEQILQAAQHGLFNPAGALGRSSERFTLQRRNAETDALTRALQVLSGQQTAAQNAYSLLSGALQTPITSSQQTAQIGNAAAASAAQIAAQQAAQAAQTNAAIQQSNSQSLGNAVAGGIGSIANYLSMPSMLRMVKLLKESERQPGSERGLSMQPATSYYNATGREWA